MATNTPASVRQYGAAIRTLLALTVILGLAYPLAMTGIAQVAFGGNANGSLVHRDGKTVGSDLIGQAFTRPVVENGKPKLDADGNPVVEADPTYFQSRPSAAGTGYDPLSTSASNLGPENKDLIAAVKERRATAARLDGVAAAQRPRRRAAGQRVGPRPAHQPGVRARAGRPGGPRTRPERGQGASLGRQSTPRDAYSGSWASRGSTSSSSTWPSTRHRGVEGPSDCGDRRADGRQP